MILMQSVFCPFIQGIIFSHCVPTHPQKGFRMSLSGANRMIGLLLGAWLGGLYGLAAASVNRIALTDLPLATTPPGFAGNLFRFALLGAVLGLGANALKSAWLSALLAGVLTTLAYLLLGISPVVWYALPGLLIGFALFGFLVYLATAGLFPRMESGKPRRQPGWLGLTILIVLLLALTQLYPADVREALRATYGYVSLGLSGAEVAPLRTVAGFPSAVFGEYVLEYLPTADGFAGKVPDTVETEAGIYAFQVVVRFENEFSFSCLFGRGIVVPPCANQ